MKSSKSEKISNAFQKFRDVQEKYRFLGASDTEPDWVMRDRVGKARGYREGDFIEPRSSRDWGLYDEPGAGRAARSLIAALRKLITTLKKVAPTRDELRGHCWRVSL